MISMNFLGCKLLIVPQFLKIKQKNDVINENLD
jgi:hypothetical protein